MTGPATPGPKYLTEPTYPELTKQVDPRFRHAEASAILPGSKGVIRGNPNQYHYSSAHQMPGVCYRRYGHVAISAESREVAS